MKVFAPFCDNIIAYVHLYLDGVTVFSMVRVDQSEASFRI